MEKLFSPDVIIKIVFAIGTLVLTVYSTIYMIRNLRDKMEFMKENVELRLSHHNSLIELNRDDIIRIDKNQVKNCNDIKHASERLDKIDERCDRRHDA